ncbi:hypothetical protein L228DRAFT_84850 [Xylona heveae TC161]|uniref:Uncharacterized protein n=1 Tax=Xylona heveae (strain CBS 132557 / TC161) TaxID=1328760 RepID=A0A165J7H1_XYLHT|nr:hypothetical protein L228DRAFT_84850 [Xylona heveae TC161]KZF25846.1 hypothetical protein L228DRAFT_84850 [Xylona heveae TC161]
MPPYSCAIVLASILHVGDCQYLAFMWMDDLPFCFQSGDYLLINFSPARNVSLENWAATALEPFSFSPKGTMPLLLT